MYKPKKYLFFLFYDIKTQKNKIVDILQELSVYVTSDLLNYNFNDNHLISHFESDVPFDDLKEAFDIMFSEIVADFYLMEINENTHIRLPKQERFNLFNLFGDRDETILNEYKKRQEDFENEFTEEETTNFQKVLNWIFSTDNPENNPDYLYESMDDEDMFIKKIKLANNNKGSDVNIDRILDKINEKGLKSLTKKEKQILENYAK